MAPSATDTPILSPASRLAAQDHCRYPPSSSRSPKRRQQFTNLELDPLLANLSPSSTLKALTATDIVLIQQDGQRDALSTSIANASTSERALAIRAALAGKKLREWYTEAKGWYWPYTGFERPHLDENAKVLQDVNHGGHLDWTLGKGGEEQFTDRGEPYWGSLPARVVEDLEKRIEIIRDDMETLDVEELKDHVRDAHNSARSRPTSSSGSDDSSLAAQLYGHLDDFTVVITATIMHALPLILRLNALLDIWSTRLLVLRRVPGWLKRMKMSQIAMEEAWLAIGRAEGDNQWVPSDLTREGFMIMKSFLGEKVSEVGQRTDIMLDMLEGGAERLPNDWIERIDDLEEDYRAWVVEAERVIDDNEWRDERERSELLHTLGNEKLPMTFTTESLPLVETITIPSNPATVEGNDEMGSVAFVYPQHNPIKVDETGAQGWNNSSTIGQLLDSDRAVTLVDGAGVEENNGSTYEEYMHEGSDTLVILEHDETKPIAKYDSMARLGFSESADTLIEPSNKNPIRNSGIEITGETLVDVLSEPSSQTLTPGADPVEFSVFPSRKERGDEDSTMSPAKHFTEESTRDSAHPGPNESDALSEAMQPLTRRPSPLVFKQEKAVGENSVLYDTSHTGSPSSGYFSNMSSPEILSASRVEYFGTPTEVNFSYGISREPTTPVDSVYRQTNQYMQKKTSALRESEMHEFVSPVSPSNEAAKFMPEDMTSEIVAATIPMIANSESERESPEIKRASIAAFEILPVGELRAINVGRKSKFSSVKSRGRVETKEDVVQQSRWPPIINRHHTFDVKAGNTKIFPSSPASLDGQDQSPSVQSHGQRASISKSQFRSEFMSARPKLLARSPRRVSKTSPRTHASTPSPMTQKPSFINSNKRKDDHKFNDLKDRSKSQNTEDQLEARITSILDNIPTRIKLTSAAHVNTGGPRRPRGNSGSLKDDFVSPALRLVRAQTSTPSMTLASTSSKVPDSRSPVGESEVKLYHLHQPGKDAPIKLYIRLVGESNERVMVRVGGGWADLGEYLKEYASHRGRRSISEGKFEIQGLPSVSPITFPSALAGMTPTSRPGTPTSQHTPSIQMKKLRFLGGSPADFRIPNTPDTPSHKQRENAPGSAGSFPSPRRASFHTPLSVDDAPLGLAGPKSKKTEISPGRQAWVDGMMNQARKVSTEKSGSLGEFGSLGRIGSTRRVFFKSSKGD